jgi:hypothetical protein
VIASTSDPFDGIARLVLDCERFGFGLDQVSMTTHPDVGWTIRMVLEVQPSADRAVITDRLSRHPTIMDLRVAELSQDECEPLDIAHSPTSANERVRP